MHYTQLSLRKSKLHNVVRKTSKCKKQSLKGLEIIALVPKSRRRMAMLMFNHADYVSTCIKHLWSLHLVIKCIVAFLSWGVPKLTPEGLMSMNRRKMAEDDHENVSWAMCPQTYGERAIWITLVKGIIGVMLSWAQWQRRIPIYPATRIRTPWTTFGPSSIRSIEPYISLGSQTPTL
ncbi:hypothetical protein VNO77_22604 [Canavalia gladiata]|uniref:Uncharacterized protein n=1 Tax=Canavalia gladiata TaxID=3824 RepID=A0AAN9L2W4_CANGL